VIVAVPYTCEIVRDFDHLPLAEPIDIARKICETWYGVLLA